MSISRRPLPMLPSQIHRPHSFQAQIVPPSSPSVNGFDPAGSVRAETILQTAKYHEELIAAFDSVDGEHAFAELARLQPIIRDLELGLQVAKKQLSKLTGPGSANWEHGPDYSPGSAGRRLAYTLVGRKKSYEEKTRAKEESLMQEWLELKKTKEEVEHHEKLLVELYASRSRFQRDSEKATLLWSQLDELYDPLFAGTTNEFPEEDVWEQRLKLALGTFTDLDSQHSRKLRVLEHLNIAIPTATKLQEQLNILICFLHIPEIERAHRPNPILKPIFRSEMKKANKYLKETQDALTQAQLLQPDILLLPIDLPSCDIKTPPHLISLICTQLISAGEAAATSLDELHARVIAQTTAIYSLKKEIEEAEKALRTARTDLRKVRRTIFERVVSQGANARPPDYEE